MRTGRPRMWVASSGNPVSWLRTAGQDDAAARLGGEGRRREPVAHHFQNLLDARLDDVHERRAGHELRLLALVFADRRHRDHVALVRSADQHTAIERLDSLGIGDAGVQPARKVEGHVVAAERETFRMDEAAAENTAIVVVPAPMSTTAAPRSASSSASTERPAT